MIGLSKIRRISTAALVLLALLAAFLATWNATPVFAECPDRYNKCVDGLVLAVYPEVVINNSRTQCVPVVRVRGMDAPVFADANVESVRFRWEGLSTRSGFSKGRWQGDDVYEFRLDAHGTFWHTRASNGSYGVQDLSGAVEY